MDVYPTDLKLDDAKRELVVLWSDRQSRRHGIRELRDNCPCATCREKRRGGDEPASPLRVLTPEELAPLTIAGMKPVGNYAYSIAFSDGHNTGIYTFELLRELGRLQ